MNALAAFVALLASGAPPPSDPRAAAAGALARCGCQTELPATADAAPPHETRSHLVPRPAVGSDPRPVPGPVADSDPRPVAGPVADSDPRPVAGPVADSEPSPVPGPVVDSEPSPVPEPVGADPRPVPAPVVDSEPTPVPEPVVDSTPQPVPPPVVVPPFLPWLALGLAGALALVWVVRTWHRAPPAQTAPPPASGPHERRERPLERQTDPDALAGQGRFTEAMHTLLLGAVAEVVRRSRPAPPASLTSRELLDGVRLPGPARGSLAGLVAAVEPALFGGRRPDRGEYEACAEHYRRFLAAWR